MADQEPSAIVQEKYRLVWSDGLGTVYILNPDHSHHQTNMNEMPRLQRAILRVHLQEVLRTIQQADAVNPRPHAPGGIIHVDKIT